MTPAGGPTLGAEAARKAIHLGTAAVPVAWASGVVSGDQVRVALSAAVAVALTVEFLRFRGGAFAERFHRQLGGLLRAHERREVSGATWLALAMCAVSWLAPAAAAIAALWAAAVGDASAALAGRTVQHIRARPSGRKSIVGSLAAAGASAIGIAWLVAAPLPVALLLGAVTAVAEWPTRWGDDNLRVAGAVAIAATLLGLR